MNNHMLSQAPEKPDYWAKRTRGRWARVCRNCYTNHPQADWTQTAGGEWLCSDFCRYIFAYGIDLT